MADLLIRLTADGSGVTAATRQVEDDLRRLEAANANANRAGGQTTQALQATGQAARQAATGIGEMGRAANDGSAQLGVLGRVGDEARQRVNGLASSAGLARNAIAGLGPAGVASFLALTAGIGLAYQGLRQFVQEQERLTRLDNILRATGNAVGLTRDQIVGAIDAVRNSSLASEQSLNTAAQALLRFRSVGSQVFGTTLRLAQDMAATFGGDVASQAQTLGRALENPAQAARILGDAGIYVSEAQRQMLEQMARTGREAQAHAEILRTVEQQVGGAGGREAGGLSGAVNGLRNAWGELLLEIGRSPAVVATAVAAINTVAGAIRAVRDAIGGIRSDGQPRVTPADNERLLAAARARLQQLEQRGTRAGTEYESIQQEIRNRERAGVVNEDRRNNPTPRITPEDTRAAEGERNAIAARNRDATERSLEEANNNIRRLATDRREIIATIERDRDREIERLRGRVGQPGGETEQEQARIQEAIAAQRRAAQRRIDAVNRRGAGEGRAADRETDRDARVVQELEIELRRLRVEEEAAAIGDRAILRLSGSAPQETIERVRDLAQQINAEREARERANDAWREGQQIFDATRTPMERLSGELRNLQRLAREGVVDSDTFARAWQQASTRAFDALRQQPTVLGAVADGLGNLADGAAKMAAAWAVGMDKAERSVLKLLQTIGSGIIERIIREHITGPLAQLGSAAISSGSNFISNLIGGLFHGGGVVGSEGGTRVVPAAAFVGAPRFHGGVGADEYPAILQKGENVFTAGQTRALGLMLNGANNNGPLVQIVDQRGASAPPIERREERGPDGRMMVKMIIREEMASAIDSGAMDKPMARNYAAARQPVRR